MSTNATNGVLLLSGGFDSAVAYSLLKNQCTLVPVHFHYYPVTGTESIDKATSLARTLGMGPLTTYPIAPIEAAILKHCPQKLFFVISKRMMIRIATAHAKNIGATFLVTGESIGQVASQTLEHLHAIAAASDLPVIRPLLTHNKEEIIRIARRIGTFDISKGPEVCNILGPKHPATKTPLGVIERAELALDIPSLIHDALTHAKTH